MDKQQAKDIINDFISWFNEHRFVIDEKLRDKISNFMED